MYDWLLNSIFEFPLMFFILNLIRYCFIILLVYWVLWIKYTDTSFLKALKINQQSLFNGQIQFELKNSILSLSIISFYETFLYYLYLNNYTRLYLEFSLKNLISELINILIIFVIHDFYFYFSHRILHTNWFFKKIHSVHHQSKVTNPCSSYSFHWFEAIIQSVYTLPIILIIPMHVSTFIIALFLTQLIVISGHCGYDLLPRWIWNSKYLGWMTTSTHHNHHHLYITSNFGLFAKFWDKVFKTINVETEKFYLKKT